MSRALLSFPSPVPSLPLSSFSSSPPLLHPPALFYFLKGVSLPMLCQKVDVLRFGSASMKTCCWGKVLGSEGCF